jgi:hypothetical protein
MDGITDPVDARVVADDFVHRIHADNLEVLIRSILVDPIAVEYTQSSASTTHTLLRNALQVPSELELIDTLVLRLSIHNALGVRALAPSSAHRHAKNDVPLRSSLDKVRIASIS